MSESSELEAYRGPERRARVTYVTRNTEYHTQAGLCVAVRDRRTGHWLLRHAALRRRLAGGVRIPPGAAVPALEEPRVGDALFFGRDGQEVLTSNLLAIDRPERATVSGYPV